MVGCSRNRAHSLSVAAGGQHHSPQSSCIDSCCYLDDGHYVGSRSLEFGEIDLEMVEFVPFRLIQDDGGAFADRVNAPKICGGVQCWVRRFRNGNLGDGRWKATPFVARGSEGGIGCASAVDGDEGLVLVLVAGGSLRVALEEAHVDRVRPGGVKWRAGVRGEGMRRRGMRRIKSG